LAAGAAYRAFEPGEQFGLGRSQRRGKWNGVFMPKFTLNTEYQLPQSLRAMGMKRGFTPPGDRQGAQFNGMSASGDLYLTAAIHKAFVSVDEKGTEATAATGIAIKGLSYTPTPSVLADRPFLFLIRDMKTGTVLFLGRITNPTK
jgi:serpin B